MPGLADQFLSIVQGSEAGQAQEARDVAAQRVQRAAGPSPTQPREIPEHMQTWGNYAKWAGSSMVDQFLDLVRHPDQLTPGTEGLRGFGGLGGMAIPKPGTKFVPLARIQELRGQGRTVPQMAQELGLSKRVMDKRISEYIRAGELPPGKGGSPLKTDIDWGEVKRMREEGKNLFEIAKSIGVSRNTLYAARVREGQRIRPMEQQGEQHKIGRNQMKTISKLFKEGLSDREIGRRYNVAPATIAQRREALGIPKLPRGRPTQNEQIEKLRLLMQEHGTSWKKIGSAMGISAQAAYGFAVRHGFVDVERIMEGERSRAKRGVKRGAYGHSDSR